MVIFITWQARSCWDCYTLGIVCEGHAFTHVTAQFYDLVCSGHKVTYMVVKWKTLLLSEPIVCMAQSCQTPEEKANFGQRYCKYPWEVCCKWLLNDWCKLNFLIVLQIYAGSVISKWGYYTMLGICENN